MFIQRYYAQHSLITDPRDNVNLYDGLPRDLLGLVKIVQGLLVYIEWAKSYNVRVPEERRQELFLRSVPQMLERILALDPSPLPGQRPPERRKLSLCRDFAVLLVSMLRHQGIPARLRIGFAGYFGAKRPRYWDHRIAEYWNESLDRWVLVDAMVDDLHRKALNLTIDPLNITDSSPFILAGDAWNRCRAGKADPDDFGDSPDDRGMPPIRYALLHDLDALNKVELVGFDAWHALIDKPEDMVTGDERRLLDEIAELTTHVDSRFDDLQALYRTTSYGRAVQERLHSLHNVSTDK